MEFVNHRKLKSKLLDKKSLFFACFCVAIFCLNRLYGWSDWIVSSGGLDLLQEKVKSNYWQVVVLYIILTIVGCVILALPGITFALVSGMLFGPVLGTLYCLIATTLGASMAFLAGRFFLKDSIKPLVEKNKHLKGLLFDEQHKKDVVLLMITRLIPIFPYNLQNFAYGITDMCFMKYTLYTFLFMAPGVALFTVGTVEFTQWIWR